MGLPSVAEWKSDSWGPDKESKKERSTWAVQRSIFKFPSLWILAASSALMYVTRYAINSWGILYLQEARGYTLVEAGFFLSINTLAGLVGAVGYGFVSDKLFNARRPPSNLLFAVIELLALLIIFFGPENSIVLGAAFILYGVGLSGLLTAIGGLFAVDIAPSRVAGAAMGFIGVFSYFGAAIQETISASLIESGSTIIDGVRTYDFSTAILFWIGCSIASMLLAASLWTAKVRD
jgi:OPA family sugar phosphate sensor protein UhpC-like MFS transporter